MYNDSLYLKPPNPIKLGVHCWYLSELIIDWDLAYQYVLSTKMIDVCKRQFTRNAVFLFTFN